MGAGKRTSRPLAELVVARLDRLEWVLQQVLLRQPSYAPGCWTASQEAQLRADAPGLVPYIDELAHCTSDAATEKACSPLGAECGPPNVSESFKEPGNEREEEELTEGLEKALTEKLEKLEAELRVEVAVHKECEEGEKAEDAQEQAERPLTGWNDPEFLWALNKGVAGLGLAVDPLAHLTPEQQEFDENLEFEQFMEEEFGEPGHLEKVTAREEAEEIKNMGNDLYKCKRFEEALEMYDKAIAKEPNDVIFYSNKCAVWIQMGSPPRLAEAIVLGRALLDGRDQMEAENPGGTTPEKLAKVRSRLATALAKLQVWNFARRCFAVWEKLTFDDDGTGSAASSTSASSAGRALSTRRASPIPAP